MTMAMLGEGGEFIVGRIRVGGETGRRLADMGFCEGSRGRVVRRGFLRGPLHVHVCDGEVMIRAEEAEGIDVEAVGAPGRRRGWPWGGGHGRGAGGQRGRAGLGRAACSESDGGLSHDPGRPGRGGPRGCCGSGGPNGSNAAGGNGRA